ncbi:hypothetical protein Tco_1005144 [Tanacetum coccineum]|uniref:Uncharacterized protein n=1 Tax=Tanacetum coccineum TaxID=301880 RepID=A0ABQ5FDW6_9ASTR
MIDSDNQELKSFRACSTRKNVDFADSIWEDFQYQIDYRQSSVRRRENMPYPRFTKFIIYYFISKHDSISKRQYEMMNDEIKNSVAYQTYLALSTGIKPPKKGIGKGKGLMSKQAATPALEKKKSVLKKRVPITAEENILFDSDEALYLVIGREETSKVDKDVVECQKNKKLKGISSNAAAQERLNLNKRTPKRRKDYILQQIPKGSSEGSVSKPEVSDEPKGKSICSSEGAEEVILSSDDERTESEKEAVESKKADKQMGNKEEVHSDEEMHIKEEKEQTDDEQYNEQVHDDEEMHDDDKKHDDGKVVDDEKEDVEMDDAEKVNAKKLGEVKVENEQARDGQADKDDHPKVDTCKDDKAGALISVTQNEKLELPLSTSSLSLSSDYCNQFLNLSSDVSLVGSVKETADTEINSLLDTTQTPLPKPPTTTEAQATVISVPDPSPTILERLLELENKVEALSKVDHYQATKESVQANVINKSSLLNPLPLLLNLLLEQLSLSKYELKKIFFDNMDKIRSYMTHDKNQELFDDLLNSVYLDEAIASGEANPDKILRKRHRDDPPAGKTQSKPSSTGKFVNADEIVEEPVHEATMDVEQPILDDVVNDADKPHDDADPKKDKSTWFKQPPRPETPDPE